MKYLSGCMYIIKFNDSLCSDVKIYWFKVDNNGRQQTVLSQQVMSPTPPARVIVTVFYQPTLLHVRVSITQLGARVPSALLSKPNACAAVVGN